MLLCYLFYSQHNFLLSDHNSSGEQHWSTEKGMTEYAILLKTHLHLTKYIDYIIFLKINISSVRG